MFLKWSQGGMKKNKANIREYGQNKIGFVFERGRLKGERYSGTFEICSNPYCRCGVVNLDLVLEQDNGKPPRYKFGVDVFKEKVNSGGGLANYFIKGLSKDDWDSLRGLYYKYKRLITETCSIEEIDACFPMEEIEKLGIMVGFYEILPYAEDLILEVGDERFLIDDQYCLRDSCPCTDAVLNFIPSKKRWWNVRSYTTIFLNYKDNSWRLERLGRNTAASPEELMNEFFRQKWGSVFIKRREKLRALYRQYKKRYYLGYYLGGPLPSEKKIGRMNRAYGGATGGSTKSAVRERKIGRNDPCPCGSGKKYKRCCGG
jgi:hypothetical protein